jgi:hypothetical protein
MELVLILYLIFLHKEVLNASHHKPGYLVQSWQYHGLLAQWREEDRLKQEPAMGSL